MIDLLNIHDPLTIQFMQKTISITVHALKIATIPISVKLTAARCLTKYLRKLPSTEINFKLLKDCLDPLLLLVDESITECIHLPIDTFTVLSRLDEASVSEIAHKVTPKMLNLFNLHHSEGNIGNELIALFKVWCRFEKCKDIFIETFIPFIQSIVQKYYHQTQGNNL
jgi:hypothetical protein